MLVTVFRLLALFVVLTVGLARSSSADPVTIYSNFGAPPGYVADGWLSSEENGYYMGFRLTEAASLRSVTLPTAWLGNLPADFAVSIRSSSGGNLGGLIEQMVIPFPAAVPAGTITLLTLASSLQPMLSANTLYFIGATPTRITAGFGFGSLWPRNNAGIDGVVVSLSPAGSFVGQGRLAAFQLTGEPNAVPEPGTMLLFATGAGFVLQRVRRRKRVV